MKKSKLWKAIDILFLIVMVVGMAWFLMSRPTGGGSSDSSEPVIRRR
jgi:preprotein translocase subunit YajC